LFKVKNNLPPLKYHEKEQKQNMSISLGLIGSRFRIALMVISPQVSDRFLRSFDEAEHISSANPINFTSRHKKTFSQPQQLASAAIR